MRGTWLLARRQVAHHRTRSLVLIACLTVTFSLPLGTRLFIRHFQDRLSERARTTPLVVGAKGSRFDLVLHALYFRGQPARETSMREVRRIEETGYARPLPLLARFKAQGTPIVGTTADYLRWRGIRVAAGESWSRYGDCLLGADAAERLQLGPGDSLMSEPENIFAVDGPFPLKMRVTGVLAPSDSPDDNAVFVELETAWIIAGIGHGHATQTNREEPGTNSNGASSGVKAGQAPSEETPHEATPAHDASLTEYTEITDDNAGSFHFHGEREEFPVSAIVAVPRDERAGTLLLGRYLADEDPAQILQPAEVIDELMTFVIRFRGFLDLALAVTATVTLLLFGLLVVLMIQLRRGEFATLYRTGCSRFLIARLIGAELMILAGASVVLTLGALGALLVALPRLSFAG